MTREPKKAARPPLTLSRDGPPRIVWRDEFVVALARLIRLDAQDAPNGTAEPEPIAEPVSVPCSATEQR